MKAHGTLYALTLVLNCDTWEQVAKAWTEGGEAFTKAADMHLKVGGLYGWRPTPMAKACCGFIRVVTSRAGSLLLSTRLGAWCLYGSTCARQCLS